MEGRAAASEIACAEHCIAIGSTIGIGIGIGIDIRNDPCVPTHT
eukprot:COSAG05_NODE_5477_length_1165_cov_0.835835_1_plen_43_part_10